MPNWILFSLLALQASISLALACIHPPREYPGKLGSKVQEYFFFREGQDIHMVMNQRIQSDKELPSEIAWVTPIPAVPKEYFEEKDNLFTQLFLGTETAKRGEAVKRGDVLKLSSEFTVHDAVYVGDYEIKPVEVLGTASGEAINAWFETNGYNKVPRSGLKYYLKPGACFLAIKVRGLKGKEKLLKPLHVVFQAREARVPLKFFANAGVFDVYVYLRSKAPQEKPVKQEELAKNGLLLDGNRTVDKEFIGGLDVKGLSADSGNIERYLGTGINSRKNRIAKWRADPLIVLE